MFPHSVISKAAAVLCTALACTAQIVHTDGGSYSRTVGNSILGGRLEADVDLETRSDTDLLQSRLSAMGRITGRLFGYQQEVAETYVRLSNRVEAGVRTRNGTYRIQTFGMTVLQDNFDVSITFPAASWTFNVFHPTPTVEVPVGPFDVDLRGNIGGYISGHAYLRMSATLPQVSVRGSSRVYARAHASVGVGIPGFGVGVGVEGRIGDQRLALDCGANALTGFFGSATYTLVPISLYLFAYVEAFWHQWDVTLCDWSASAIERTLF